MRYTDDAIGIYPDPDDAFSFLAEGFGFRWIELRADFWRMISSILTGVLAAASGGFGGAAVCAVGAEAGFGNSVAAHPLSVIANAPPQNTKRNNPRARFMGLALCRRQSPQHRILNAFARSQRRGLSAR